MSGSLWAVSDLHVAFEENRSFVERLRPESPDDWLLVAGDVGEYAADVEWALGILSERFDTVIWTPGNHELWTPRDDPVQLRGERRYRHLVDVCRRLGVTTPEDPYLVWRGAGGPVTIVPLFLLYDYSFRPPGAASKSQALAMANDAGILCTDEVLLHPEPYRTMDDWCAARIEATEGRLAVRDTDLRTVLVNHFPLVREPTRILRHPEFALWCGTDRTADWHRKYDAAAVVYGHLHIPRTLWQDGVRFEEVSVGYPREWRRRGGPVGLKRVFPDAPT